MYVGGEIADLARIARPSIGVVTAVQAVHLSRIGSLAAIEPAKGELVEALPSDGTAVLNADDRRSCARMADRTAARVLTYGFADDADVGAEAVASAGFDGMRFTLRLAGRPARPATDPGARPAVRPQRARRGGGRRRGRTIEPTRSSTGSRGGWSAPHRGQVVRAGTGRRSSTTRTTRRPGVRDRGARHARRPARPPGRGPRRDARARGGPEIRPPRGREAAAADGRPARRRRGGRGRRSPTGAAPPGWTRRASSRRATAKRRSITCGRGCARATSSSSRRRAASSSTCWSTASPPSLGPAGR